MKIVLEMASKVNMRLWIVKGEFCAKMAVKGVKCYG